MRHPKPIAPIVVSACWSWFQVRKGRVLRKGSCSLQVLRCVDRLTELSVDQRENWLASYWPEEPHQSWAKIKQVIPSLLPMTPMLDQLSLEGLAAVAALIITLLSGLCGGAWWASAMYTRVGQLVTTMQKMNETLANTQVTNDLRFVKVEDRLDQHGNRLIKIEAKTGL